MVDEPLDKGTAHALVEAQKQELQLKYRELDIVDKGIQAREKDLENQTKVALKNMDVIATDREQERQVFGKESVRQKIFVFGLVVLFIIFACFLVIFGHIELLKDLITFGIAFVGGFGYSHYLRRNSD
ncbi:MAG: hypothetical protein OXU76_03830 [Alphaproteobacteria bacterium]|nr:hypothetical protein [Alphaproteobacteria bacterium]